MQRTARVFVPVFMALVSGCLPESSVVLHRNANDAATDAASDVSFSDTMVPDGLPSDGPAEASSPDALADVADVPPPMTDEVWSTRVVPAVIGCDVGQWCWQNPLPQGDAVFDAVALSPNEIWVVGGRGLAMRWSGGEWTLTRTGTTDNVLRVWGTRSNDVWAITQRSTSGGGDFTGTLLHWEGTRWVQVSLPFTDPPGVVHGSGPNDVWVATWPNRTTRSSALWRYDGARWTEVREGLPEGTFFVNDLWVERAGRVWMYGRPSSGAHAYTVYRYDGARWTLLEDIRDSVAHQAFTGRIAGAGGEVFLRSTGIDGESASYIACISQSPFRYEPPPVSSPGTFDTLVSTGGSVWYLGATQLYRRGTSRWEAMPFDLPNERVRGISVLVASDASRIFGFNAYADVWYHERDWELLSGANKPSFRGVSSVQGRTLVYGLGRSHERLSGGAWVWRERGVFTEAAEVYPHGEGTVLAVRTEGGRLVLVDERGERDLSPPMGSVVDAAFVSSGALWALAGNRVTQWDGTRWQDAPALPARVGDIETGRADLRFLETIGERVFVAGGVRRVELENEYTDFLCQLRAGSWACTSIATMRPFTFHGSNVTGLAASPTGALWGLVAGRLARFDTETLAASTVGLSTGEAHLSSLSVGPSGELVAFANGPVVLRPATRSAERYEHPTSGYAGQPGVAGIGADGALYLAGSHGELLRYRAR